MAPLLCPGGDCPEWYVIATVALGIGIFFVLAEWAWTLYTGSTDDVEVEEEHRGAPPHREPSLFGFVHVSASSMSGKGWAPSGQQALNKLVALSTTKPTERNGTVARHGAALLNKVRGAILSRAANTRFVECGRIYISGDDREATRRAVTRLAPRAHLVLV